ncbi:MAG: hypothetical protein WCO06_03215 [Candidatus Roizmanbacteria bacterium]
MKKGFTLMEVLIYITLLIVISDVLLRLTWNVIEGYSKRGVISETYYIGRIISERLKDDLRNATNIDTVNSNFGVNLATTTGSKITLISDSAQTPIIFSVSNGQLVVSYAGVATTFSSLDYKISSLVFTNLSTTNGYSRNIKYVMILNSNATNKGKIYDSNITIQSSIELRGH